MCVKQAAVKFINLSQTYFFLLFSIGRKKSFTLASAAASVATSATQINSHIIMTNNAMFLLDLASASNSNLVNISKNSKAMTASILSSVSELGCMDPNPFPLVPFQVSLCHSRYHFFIINPKYISHKSILF